MTVYRDKRDPVKDLTYAEAYDLGGRDFQEGKPRLTTRPRNPTASAGRFGYSDGYNDAQERSRQR